jgi:cytochrome c-type biogenesis protein CcmH
MTKKNPRLFLRIKTALTAALFAAAAAQAGGIEIVDFEDAARQARYADLIRELRCLVCQNQTLADSNAELAQDMRAVVRRMMRDGASDGEIVAFMTARYGDFVRYRPPVNPGTVALWLAPFALALIAPAAVWALIRRRRRVSLDAAQREKASRLLG